MRQQTLLLLLGFTVSVHAGTTVSGAVRPERASPDSTGIEDSVTAASIPAYLPEGLTLGNQLEYSYDTELRREILENWLNLDYRRGVFMAGLRFDVFEPNDPNPAVQRGKERYADVATKYIGIEVGSAEEGGNLTAGNYYVMVGRGLVLKSYEDRTIRVDNNLLGVMGAARYAGLRLTALSGRGENALAERSDIVHLVDLEYRTPWAVRFGGTYAANLPETEASATRMAAARLQASTGPADVYAEYGMKMNRDLAAAAFPGSGSLVGRAWYLEGSLTAGSLALLGEYKMYDNFSFTSSDRTIAYNTPPALRLEYPYTLLSRHPSPLDADNEEGYRLETQYAASDKLTVEAAYEITRTLNARSRFQRLLQTSLPSRIQQREAFGRLVLEGAGPFSATLAYGYNEELAANTKSITPIAELQVALDERRSIRLEVEHQYTRDRSTRERYYDDLVVVEYLQSPSFSLSMVGELLTREPLPGRRVRQGWAYCVAGVTLGTHSEVSLFVGSRQAGYTCVGGMCRFEPEFRGVEFKIMTRM